MRLIGIECLIAHGTTPLGSFPYMRNTQVDDIHITHQWGEHHKGAKTTAIEGPCSVETFAIVVPQ
jgi:hypothetical protein